MKMKKFLSVFLIGAMSCSFPIATFAKQVQPMTTQQVIENPETVEVILNTISKMDQDGTVEILDSQLSITRSTQNKLTPVKDSKHSLINSVTAASSGQYGHTYDNIAEATYTVRNIFGGKILEIEGWIDYRFVYGQRITEIHGCDIYVTANLNPVNAVEVSTPTPSGIWGTTAFARANIAFGIGIESWNINYDSATFEVSGDIYGEAHGNYSRD